VNEVEAMRGTIDAMKMDSGRKKHNGECQSINEQLKVKEGRSSRSLLHTGGLIPCSRVAFHSEGKKR
jgi:hypothetical protein